MTHLKISRALIADMEDVRLKVISTLLYKNKPIKLTDIVKITKQSAPLIRYHLDILMDEGVVLCILEENIKYYMLQPFFYDTTLMEGLSQALLPIATVIGNDIAQNEEEFHPMAIINSMKYVIQIFLECVSEDCKNM